MKEICTIFLITCIISCNYFPGGQKSTSVADTHYSQESYPSDSWEYFLQNLPTTEGPVLDYTGAPIANQGKHAAIVNYDVGHKNLQQCADALIRLRAEYLFTAGRYDEIQFHFTSGHLYRWRDYCDGIRPVPRGISVDFARLSDRCQMNHSSLRRYLDIVFMYAGTISLAQELKPIEELKTGTVIISPGSPGHCSIIVDEATTEDGEKIYKLAEGYTPAQSIYILRNLSDGKSAWYHLKAGEPIQHSSYSFTDYQLGLFQ